MALCKRFVAALLFTAAVTAAAEEPKVSIESAFALPSTNGLRLVSFSYAFPNRTAVLLTDFGVVAANGSMKNYLTRANVIEFRDPGSNELLLRKPIDTTGQIMGGRNSPPDEGDFPTVARSAAIPAPPPFADRVASAAQRFFPDGFASWQSDGVYRYATTYRGIVTRKPGKRAEIAVLITQPHEPGGKPTFRVRWLLRERGRLSGDWTYTPDVSSETSDAAKAFLDALMGQLQR